MWYVVGPWVATRGGRLHVVEYSELPTDLAAARDPATVGRCSFTLSNSRSERLEPSA